MNQTSYPVQTGWTREGFVNIGSDEAIIELRNTPTGLRHSTWRTDHFILHEVTDPNIKKSLIKFKSLYLFCAAPPRVKTQLRVKRRRIGGRSDDLIVIAAYTVDGPKFYTD